MNFLIEFVVTTFDRFFVAAVRGGIILGALYFIFWIIKAKGNEIYKIPMKGTVNPSPLREAFLTMSSFFIYSAMTAVVLFITKFTSFSRMYLNVNDYGWTYTIISIPLFLLYSDMMFYWSHKLMHTNRFFNRAHVAHHRFVNPTPWAAFAFHAGEAFINSFSFFILMLMFPWHPVAFVLFVVISISYNGYIHLGYDFTPLSWRNHFLMKWLNTPTHHSFHHHKNGSNFSFIFTIWDKLMGTEYLPVLTENHKKQFDQLHQK